MKTELKEKKTRAKATGKAVVKREATCGITDSDSDYCPAPKRKAVAKTEAVAVEVRHKVIGMH